MAAEKDAGKPNRLLVIATVSFYLVAALAMVMANKWVLNTTSTPLFFLFTQLVIAVILFLISHVAGLIVLPFNFGWPLLRGLAPMIGLNVIGLSFSNYTLKYVDASFYQVARGLVLPFTVLTSYVFLASRPSLFILAACALVTLGFFVGVLLDGVRVSALGVAFGVASSASTALHAVVIKKSLELLGGSALSLSWYTNLFSAGILSVLLLVVGEGPGVVELLWGGEAGWDDDAVSVLRTFLLGSMITGVFGFLMSLASLLSIKVTSPITHMVSSAVRGVAASFLGVWLFHDIISSGRAASIAIILFGSILYTWVKHIESQRPNPRSVEKGGYERVPLDEIEDKVHKPAPA